MIGDLAFEGLRRVQPAGSVKSSVHRTSSFGALGAAIIIEPTLALNSDQSSKFNHVTSGQGVLVCLCQLDFQKRNEQRNVLVNIVLSMLK